VRPVTVSRSRAYLWWLRAGSPGHHRYGITVGAEGMRMWLDNPANVVGEPLPLSTHAAQQGA